MQRGFSQVQTPDPPELAEIKKLLSEAGNLRRAGKFDPALELANQALAKAEKELGPDHALTGNSLLLTGQIHRAKGAYPKALPLLERVLALREKNPDPKQRNVAISLTELGSLFDAMGDYAKAETTFQRALEIFEKGFGPESYEVVVVATLRTTLADRQAHSLPKRLTGWW